MEELRSTLRKFDQEHLLDFIDELTEAQKKSLINDIENVGLERVCEIFKEVNEDAGQSDQSDESVLEPLSDKVYQSIKDLTEDKKEHYKKIGEFNYLVTEFPFF